MRSPLASTLAALFTLSTIGAVAVVVASSSACSLTVDTNGLTCSGDTCPNGGSAIDAGASRADSGKPGDGGTCKADLMNDSANCGSCGSACAATETCVTGVCRGACGGGILYVAPTGSDSYDGCTEGFPLETIGAAVARAAAANAGVDAGSGVVEEIHVCAGSYLENVPTVSARAVLRGGYNCTSWARTATYGYPSFDAVNETRVASLATDGTGGTIKLSGPAVDATTVVDGFTVLLSASVVPPTTAFEGSSGDASAVYVVAGASPTITNCHMSGGASDAQRSFGVSAFHAAPHVMSNLIEAGGGQQSIGVYYFEPTAGAIVQNNIVHGGAATQNVSEGIQVAHAVGATGMTGANAISGNTVEGGTGFGGSVGIAIDESDAEVTHNTIDGGGYACTNQCASFGVYTEGTANNVLVDANRIVGSSSTNFGQGIFVNQAPASTITNNVVFGGTSEGSNGIAIDQGGASVVRHNTVTTAGVGLHFIDTANATVENNLGFALDTTGVFLASDNCTSMSTFASVMGNGMVGYQGREIAESAGCSTTLGIAGLQSGVGAQASANVRIDSTCAGETAATSASCDAASACATSVAACDATVASGLDSAGQGRAAALDPAQGYPLVSSAPCLVTQGGVDRTSSVAVDILGATRTVPVSIGAYESDLTTCTK